MKILYALQGNGNGHISRALDIIPALRKYASVDIFISGKQAELSLPYRVKYVHKGLNFVFDKNGGLGLWKTILNAKRNGFPSEVSNVPVQDYDLVINDFEPVTAWASVLRRKPCISLSHLSAILTTGVPKPEGVDFRRDLALRYYAPCSHSYGFHYHPSNDHLFTPVIRQQVREATNRKGKHVTVYLPSYTEEELVSVFSSFSGTEWEIFSKHSSTERVCGNILIRPVDNDSFVESIAQGKAVLCGAGFQTPAEALYLGKKLMVIPMEQHFDQYYNAAALSDLGVPVLKNLDIKQAPVIEKWLKTSDPIRAEYTDQTEKMVLKLLDSAESFIHRPDLSLNYGPGLG